MLRAIALSLICAAMAFAVAACGESGSGGDADPASLVPANAPVYAQAAVRPQGEQREGALAAAGKVMRTDDPAGTLRELIDEAFPESDTGLTWEKDFAPWVGEEVGVWAATVESQKPSWAAITAVKDTEAAAATLARVREAADTTFTKRSHGGVDYDVAADGTAVGLVDDFLVAGTEDAFKRSVELREGGESLAESDAYKDAMDDLHDDRLGQFFLDTKAMMALSAADEPDQAAIFDRVESALQLDELGPLSGSFQADGDGMAIDSVSTGIPEGPLGALTELSSGTETEIMPKLPGDAWGAFAVPKLGESGRSLFDAFAGVLGAAAVESEFKESTGLDLQEDVFSWIGDTGMFIRGKTIEGLDGALVIQSTDDDKASVAFLKIVGLIGKQSGTDPEPLELDGAETAFALATPGAPKPIVLARRPDRVVAAYGEEAAAAALEPQSTLSDSELYGDAEDALEEGQEPSFLLSTPALIELVEAAGETDAEWDKAKPYLEAFGAITAGGSVDGETAKSRIAVTLK
jgi:hypothetical protein